MQMKKTLIVFVLFLPVYLISEWSVASNRDNNSPALIEKFKITHAENTAELPAIELL